MKLNSILDQIDLGSYALPEFQRGYVWNRDQVRKLMTSLYKGYPIGSILTWSTRTDPNITRGNALKSEGTVNLILDGQQRITTLYGLIRGKRPPFFEGDEKVFTGLYFNVIDDNFEFYLAMKMSNDMNWISVTELMREGAGNYVQEHPHLLPYLGKLNAISNIREYDLPVQEVSGEDKTVDVVVEIFNNVNSGGTKLSKGDLALAKLCAQWTDARQELRSVLEKFSQQGFTFSMDWLLRCVTVYLTAQPYFSFLNRVETVDFQKGVYETEKLIGTVLDQIGSRLGLDHDRVLQGRFAIPVIIEIIKRDKLENIKHKQWNKILYWYIHSFLWGRYSGSTESVLAQDLKILENGGGIDGLISHIRKDRGSLEIQPDDFKSWSTGARFYPLIYLMTRVYGCVDWMSGIELKNALLGKNSSLEIHHIFPKSLLYDAGFSKSEVNTLANYTFLTKNTNLAISNREPSQYLPDIDRDVSGALSSHWIPQDTSLWEVANYTDFANERRVLLSEAANSFLQKLYNSDEEGKLVRFQEDGKPIQITEEDEEEIILELSVWMEEKGFNAGEINYNITNESGELIAILDLAWPNGVQEGLSVPIALLLDEPEDLHQIASESGFKYFVDAESFKNHIEREYLF